MNKRDITSLCGTATVRVRGQALEEFINLAISQGIPLWDVELASGEMLFKTNYFSLKKIKTLDPDTIYSVEVIKKEGIWFFAHKLWKRKVFIVGFLCFWIVIYALSGLVWQLDVEGAERVSKADVLQFVQTMGLEKWARFNNLDLDYIQHQMYVQFPEIAWVAVERTGTRVLVEIVEKEADLESAGPIDIVAKYDGIISEMMVLQGAPMVEEGMTVAQGDILISGHQQNQHIVNAAGSVLATVYFEGYGEATELEYVKNFTGQTHTVSLLQVGDINIPLSKTSHGFSEFELAETRCSLRGNPDSSVHLIKRTYKELEVQTNKYAPEQAQELAQQRALIAAHQQVEEHAQVLDAKTEDVSDIQGIYKYKALLTVETKIGTEAYQEGNAR